MREKLARLIKERSLKLGNFILASGRRSNYYIDARIITLDPEGAELISELFLQEIYRHKEVEAIGGMSLGADPIVSSVVLKSYQKGKPISGFLVRKKEKEHGMGKRIEGNIKPGWKVVIVDDVVTSGNSLLEAARAAEDAGAKVMLTMAVVDREEGGAEKIKEKYPFFSIFKISELMEGKK